MMKTDAELAMERAEQMMADLKEKSEEYILFYERGIPFKEVIFTAMKEACSMGLHAGVTFAVPVKTEEETTH